VNYQLQLGRLTDAQAPVGSPTLAGGVLIPAVQATFSLIPSAKAFAQLEAAPATFASGAWTAVNFASAPLNNGITLSGTNITVPRAGTYRVTLSYRNGTGGDVWTAIRLFGDGTTRGISAGTGNISPSPELFTYSFLADIANPAVPYQIQLGRHSSTLAIATPAAIAGQTPPAIVATIEEL
jgi:hypothetical protein